MTANSTPRRPGRKASTKQPTKPGKDFPLSIHKGTGYWTKKVRGRCYYFGKLADDPNGQQALEEWLRVKDDLLAGREPRPIKDDELTVADLCNLFLARKEQMKDNGELSIRTFRGYYDTCEVICKALGKTRSVTGLTPDDFRKFRAKLAEGRGPTALRNVMQRVRSVFKFAFEAALANLPTRAVNVEKNWVDFARVKTAVPRRIPLWPETVEAIRQWLPNRPKAKDPANSKLLFLTVRGACWTKVSAKVPQKTPSARNSLSF